MTPHQSPHPVTALTPRRAVTTPTAVRWFEDRALSTRERS